MSLVDTLTTLAAQSGVQVIAESNVTPAFVLYDARDNSPSLLDAIGVRTHLVVRTADGKTLAEYGTSEPKDYVLAGVLVALIVTAVTLIGGAAVKAIKSV